MNDRVKGKSPDRCAIHLSPFTGEGKHLQNQRGRTMARQKMVTRTVGITRITAVVLNVDTLESHETTITVTGKYEPGTKELKSLLASKSTETLMYAKASSCVYEEKLYGMSEEDFLTHAKELPPRTKADEADE